MVEHLRKIFQDICAKIEYNYVGSIEEQRHFMVRLKALDCLERAVLAEKVYGLDWNQGSSGVFSSLQSLGIADISVLILRQTDPESVENILNDLIENSPDLLATLINAYCCVSKGSPVLKLRTHLDEYFTKLVAELTTEDADAVSVNYLVTLKPHLPVAYLQEIRNVHIKLFLGTTNTSANEAISKQKEWVAAAREIERTTLNGLMRECIVGDALKQLLERVSKDPNFNGWQYFLMFVFIAAVQDKLDVFKMFKSFLKDTFANCISRKSQHLFYVMMLTARQLSYSAVGKFNDYQKWYKDAIGELVYSNMKVSAESFEFVMALLTGMIESETDPDLVNVHINTAISAPAKCNELVLLFKKQSRSHLDRAERKLSGLPTETLLMFDEQDDDDVIILDD